MQLCCIETDDGPRAAIHLDGQIFELSTAVAALEDAPDGLAGLNATSQILLVAQSEALRNRLTDIAGQLQSTPESAVSYGIPIAGPVIGVGRNYQDHVSEGGLAVGQYPKLFFNLSNALAANRQEIQIPTSIRKADWEAELGVVIGRRMRGVKPEDVLSYVAGFLNVNDVSAREFQFDYGPAQTSFAKSMDGFCPCGPWLVTIDEIADCQQLEVRCEVNGITRQHSNTAYMIFSVVQILSHISQFMTLEPGCLIATGTPDGVGHFLDPPQYLNDGDIVRVSVQGLGILENRFVREKQ